MPVLADGRVRRTAAEWRAVAERFEASGLSALAFCRRERISRAAFTRWRYELARPAPGAGGFVEIPASPPERLRVLEPGEMEFTLPGGVLLRWRP